MRRRTHSSNRVLPDGTPLRNRLLSALPAADYKRISTHLRLQSTVTGDTLHQNGHRIDKVYFPNGGVFSVTNRMRDGTLVEVATVGNEGMLGVADDTVQPVDVSGKMPGESQPGHFLATPGAFPEVK